MHPCAPTERRMRVDNNPMDRNRAVRSRRVFAALVAISGLRRPVHGAASRSPVHCTTPSTDALRRAETTLAAEKRILPDHQRPRSTCTVHRPIHARALGDPATPPRVDPPDTCHRTGYVPGPRRHHGYTDAGQLLPIVPFVRTLELSIAPVTHWPGHRPLLSRPAVHIWVQPTGAVYTAAESASGAAALSPFADGVAGPYVALKSSTVTHKRPVPVMWWRQPQSTATRQPCERPTKRPERSTCRQVELSVDGVPTATMVFVWAVRKLTRNRSGHATVRYTAQNRGSPR